MFMLTQKIKFSAALLALLTCLGSSSPVLAVWTPPINFTTDDLGSGPAVAADAQGNGMALYLDEVGPLFDLFASYYTAGAWQSPQVLDSNSGGLSSLMEPALAMDASGTAIAVWREIDTIIAKQFKGGIWGVPTALEFQGDVPAVAMNGSGKGIAVWFNFGLSEVHASFFTGIGWTFPVVIGTTTFPDSLTVAYSEGGSVVVGWNDFPANNVVANNYVNGSWLGPQVLGAALHPQTKVEVGIDAKGKALVLWTDLAASNVVVSFFNGTTWQPSQIISPAPGNDELSTSLAMSSNGTAVAAWADSSSNGLSSVFNGTTWGPAIQFQSGLGLSDSPRTSVTIDSVGNADVVWSTLTGLTNSQIYSAQLPVGASAWVNQELVYTSDTTDVDILRSALSANGARFAVWQTSIPLLEGSNVLGSASPSSPAGLKGKVCKNSFASQSGRVKTISWKPSLDSSVVAYELRRNGELIATIPQKGPFTYKDYNRCKQSDVYTLTVVYSTGLVSEPLTVTVK